MTASSQYVCGRISITLLALRHDVQLEMATGDALFQFGGGIDQYC